MIPVYLAPQQHLWFLTASEIVNSSCSALVKCTYVVYKNPFAVVVIITALFSDERQKQPGFKFVKAEGTAVRKRTDATAVIVETTDVCERSFEILVRFCKRVSQTGLF